MARHDDQPRIRRLLDVGRVLMSELDQEAVLRRVLEVGCEFTEARYAALGILNAQRTGLERFVTFGMDEPTRRQIGDPPVGRGVLGVLIDEPRSLRLDDVCRHPRSYGFPAGHPVMRTFLGVPVLIRGQAWGNLYLAEKRDSRRFTEEDEHVAGVLADWAAIAIDNARLYETSERRRIELEQAVLGLQATRDVAIAIGSDLSVEHALELIVKRGRALVGARSVVIMLRDGPDLVFSAGAGHVEDLRGTRVPIAGSTSGEVLESKRSQRIANVKNLLIAPNLAFGVSHPHAALLVPLLYRSESVGLLVAFDRGTEGESFTAEDERLLESFAASAATAVAMAQSAQSDRLRSALAAADAERRRWGRELHDETLQGLGGLRLLLSSALRRGEPAQLAQAAGEAIGHIEREIKNLRSIISELRPAALDDLGLRAAIETLVEHHREMYQLEIAAEVSLPDPDEGQARLDPELEVGVYRLVQEALNNVVKHAQASAVALAVKLVGSEVTVEVADDGVGFSTDTRSEGFGLVGMRERVRLADGALSIHSTPGEGTVVRARLSAVSGDDDLSAIVFGGGGADVAIVAEPTPQQSPSKTSAAGETDPKAPPAAERAQTPSRPRRSA